MLFIVGLFYGYDSTPLTTLHKKLLLQYFCCHESTEQPAKEPALKMLVRSSGAIFTDGETSGVIAMPLTNASMVPPSTKTVMFNPPSADRMLVGSGARCTIVLAASQHLEWSA